MRGASAERHGWIERLEVARGSGCAEDSASGSQVRLASRTLENAQEVPQASFGDWIRPRVREHNTSRSAVRCHAITDEDMEHPCLAIIRQLPRHYGCAARRMARSSGVANVTAVLSANASHSDGTSHAAAPTRHVSKRC